MNSFGEATYWHNHPDLARRAQIVREQLDRQRVTVTNSRDCGQIAQRR